MGVFCSELVKTLHSAPQEFQSQSLVLSLRSKFRASNHQAFHWSIQACWSRRLVCSTYGGGRKRSWPFFNFLILRALLFTHFEDTQEAGFFFLDPHILAQVEGICKKILFFFTKTDIWVFFLLFKASVLITSAMILSTTFLAPQASSNINFFSNHASVSLCFLSFKSHGYLKH